MNLTPIIDADILRYEIGFAAEVGWRAITEDKEALPPFSYVEEILLNRINTIRGEYEKPEFYLSEGECFRNKLATVKPYKGTRINNKPWHYNNLSVYFKDVLGAKVITEIEADDALAIRHVSSGGTTLLCSRDKDLRQVPGWFYSWELGKQPSFGPIEIDKIGNLSYDKEKNKLFGTGLSFFYSQCLTGDPVDNIPGLPGIGPKKAWDILEDCENLGDYRDRVEDCYYSEFGKEKWEEQLLEQGRLLWMIRRLHEDGSPVLWELGMEE